MTGNNQRSALSLLAEVWAFVARRAARPIICSSRISGRAHIGRGLGDIEDDEFLAILNQHKAELQARLHDVPTVVP